MLVGIFEIQNVSDAGTLLRIGLAAVSEPRQTIRMARVESMKIGKTSPGSTLVSMYNCHITVVDQHDVKCKGFHFVVQQKPLHSVEAPPCCP